MRGKRAALLCHSSVAVVLAVALIAPSGADAQTTGNGQAAVTSTDHADAQAASPVPDNPRAAGDQAAVPDIIVTGTSIRGVAPVGSNLISVGCADIESTNAQTAQQILKTVP